LLLVAPAHAHDERFLAALRPLLNAVPVEDMRTANYMVDRDADKATPEAAALWLAQRIKSRSAPKS
jgi:osmoprotectant transport system permease protein